MFKHLFFIVNLVVVLVAFSVNASASDMIKKIEVSGAQRIEANTIKTYLDLRIGEVYTKQDAEKSLQNLFATGLFSDVEIDYKSQTLFVKVKENPIVNRIAFEGNKKLKDDALLKEITSRPRVVYTRARVQTDVQNLLTAYRRSGRFAAQIVPKIIERDENRVDLVFEIKEGDPTKVRDIKFIGNKIVSESKLKKIITTKESAWYRFFSTGDRYDPDRMAYDRELLRQYYMSQGYADFKVLSSVAELTPDEKSFVLTFSVEEGERYRVGEITIESKIKDLDSDVLYDAVTFSTGEWYNTEEVKATVDSLKDKLGNLQYAFVEIDADADKKVQDRIINIIFVVNEGPKVFIERVNINGNVRTIDKVIRRELVFVEGDPYTNEAIKDSKRNLGYVDYFSKVDIEESEGTETDLTVVDVTVEEKSTGEISIGAGYGTSDGIFGDVQFKERNLVGTGKTLAVKTRLGQNSRSADVSLREPYFLDRNMSAGVNVFYVERKGSGNINYETTTMGAGVDVGYALGDNLRQSLKYSLESIDVKKLPNATTSRLFREEKGKHTVSQIGQYIIYDTRDSYFDPSYGYFMSLDTSLAGLGGDSKYLQNIVEGGVVYSVIPKWVLSLKGQYGNIFGYSGKEIRLSDRFTLGGDNLRGFEDGGVGPREIIQTTGKFSSDSLGGTNIASGTLGLAFPLGLPDEFDIKGHVYTDFGTLWDPDVKLKAGEKIVDDKYIRASAGVGLSYMSPVGPIRVDYAVPYRKKSYDRLQKFRISFGTRF